MEDLDALTVQSQLGLSDRFKAWLDQIAAPGRADEPVLPDDASVDAMLVNLGVEERDSCLESRPDPKRQPALWWVLGQAYREVIAKMGRSLEGGWYTGWPSLPEHLDLVGRQLYVWVFLAATPAVQRLHRERGIPSDVSQASLSTLGKEISTWSQITGHGGINGTWVLPLVFQGASYRLGRHVFDRYGSSLNVHVPAGGPLDPAASQASFDWARAFFPRHFPEDDIETFGCHSWLPDNQWERYLPETSNAIRFQRRFTVAPDDPGEPGDSDILQFVFLRESDGPTPTAELLNSLPQDTSLQRAYVAHLRNGGHWWTRNGWFPF